MVGQAFQPANHQGGIFSVALSVENGLTGPSRPLAGTLPCGDRTFLPASGAATHPASYVPIMALCVGQGKLASFRIFS